jgi:hypothetical protein
MRIAKKTFADITDRIEGVLDFIPALDKVKFSDKREAAEIAAQALIAFLQGEKV